MGGRRPRIGKHMKQLEESVESFLGTLGGIIWGPWVLIPLLAITGLLLTIRLRGIQFTKLIPALRLGIKDRKDADAEEGDVSPSSRHSLPRLLPRSVPAILSVLLPRSLSAVRVPCSGCG